MDGYTDGQQTKCDHKSTPCHYVTGDLKTAICLFSFYQHQGSGKPEK